MENIYREIQKIFDSIESVGDGGNGSGNFNHGGRPGKLGGSSDELNADISDPEIKRTNIQSIKNAFDKYEWVAIRGLSGVNAQKKYKTGQKLAASIDDWEGRGIEYNSSLPRLNGTSGILLNREMSDEEIQDRIQKALKYSDSDRIALIAGDKAEYGADQNELVINNALFLGNMNTGKEIEVKKGEVVKKAKEPEKAKEGYTRNQLQEFENEMASKYGVKSKFTQFVNGEPKQVERVKFSFENLPSEYQQRYREMKGNLLDSKLYTDIAKVFDSVAEFYEDTQDGGSGSGNFGHSGRAGKVGGSSKSGFMSYLDEQVKSNPDQHSIAKYINPETDKLTPNRSKLHADVIRGYFEGAKQSDTPTIYFNGGGSASGKSTAVESGVFGDVPTLKSKNGIVVDPDELKKVIPEYNERVKAGDSGAAGYAHEESSALAKLLFKKATSIGSYDVLMDGTLAGNPEKAAKKIINAKKTGRPVVGNFVTVDTDEALKRNYLRYLKSGRMPSTKEVIKIHKQVSNNFPIIAPLFNKTTLVDNNISPRKIAETGENGKLKILDKEAYEKFLNKTNESEEEVMKRFEKMIPEYEKEYLKKNPGKSLRKRPEF